MANVKSRRKQDRPNTKPKKSADLAKPYVPNEAEKKVLEAQRERKASRPVGPTLKLEKSEDGANQLLTDHPDQYTGWTLLLEAVGTADPKFIEPFTRQLVNAGIQGQDLNDEGPNFLLSVVKSIHPRDELEAMLAAQMAAVHMATMTFARRLANVDNIVQQDSAERAFNKLSRTFTMQMEALKKYRDAPQQRVHVEHVHVNEGGQAIVGNVEGAKKNVE